MQLVKMKTTINWNSFQRVPEVPGAKFSSPDISLSPLLSPLEKAHDDKLQDHCRVCVFLLISLRDNVFDTHLMMC